MKCYKCQKNGHIQRDYLEWKRDKEEDNERSSRFANIVTIDTDSNGDLCSVSSNVDWLIDSWVLDSTSSFT